MKKYGRSAIALVSLVVITLCVLTASTVAHGPGWLARAHGILGSAAIVAFIIVAAEPKIFDPPTPWQKYDGSIRGL